ncbi:hypothetical protein [Curtobacterium sp. MCBA15_001]|uniref:hypothetical protein n=1 Tax=Curtobacterium sp. MCBA15_001 TaxID=1898731 RepID=UPI0008DCC8D3|nr:hypothetical protein [Curtobacterium sp. MCBA15_001]OIH95207.1 hypothetical protein BIU90_03510 [Curtobacterium sp. MCBA15_001]
MIPVPDCPLHRVDDDTPVAVARQLQRAAGTSLVRLARGLYADRARWGDLDDRSRHLIRVSAVVGCLPAGSVFGGESALLLHGIRLLARAPNRVVVVEPRDRVDRRSELLERRPSSAGEVVRVWFGAEQVPVLDLAASAAAAARSMPFRDAVVVLDQVLRRGVPRAAIAALIEVGSSRCRSQALTALAFADARSDSVGESVARVVLHEAGAPEPELQHVFRSPDGLVARVDFWFPDQGVVVEYDGVVKYRDRTMRAGRSPEQVVIDEKRRQDWICRDPAVRGFVRLDAHDLRSVPFVAATLRQAGVPAAG